jgi:hypothetical protein
MDDVKIVWVARDQAGNPEVIFGDEGSATAYASDRTGVVVDMWQVSRYEDRTVKAA